MAYPGVFMLDDASIFKLCAQPEKTADSSACTPKMAVRIDVIVQRPWRKEKKGAEVSRVDSTTTAEAEAVSRAIALAEMAAHRFTSFT